MKSPWWQPHHQAVRAFQWRRAFYREILITRVPSVNEEETLPPGFGLAEAAQPHRLYNWLVRPRIRLMSLEIACFTPHCKVNTRHYHKQQSETWIFILNGSLTCYLPRAHQKLPKPGELRFTPHSPSLLSCLLMSTYSGPITLPFIPSQMKRLLYSFNSWKCINLFLQFVYSSAPILC